MAASINDNDVHDRFGDIKKRCAGNGITAQLVELQKYQVLQKKPREFLQTLQCLYFSYCKGNSLFKDRCNKVEPSKLWRRQINAEENGRYISLSYPWQSGDLDTDPSTGAYLVQRKDRRGFTRSEVRNSVFRRVHKFMVQAYGGSLDVRYLWIDQHCVEQDNLDEKEIGMQAMDRVYSLSDHSLALLTNPIRTSRELRLLSDVLDGEFVDEDAGAFTLTSNSSFRSQASNAIELLRYITQDVWFERGWIFQENYRAGIKMTLLIPHHIKNLEASGFRDFGSVFGELCVSSVEFHKEATKLCLAYQSVRSIDSRPKDILNCAPRYQILLQSMDDDEEIQAPRSMTHMVINDILNRKLEHNWDCLPIVANCCHYTQRLDSAALQKKGFSLSLAILAQCLVNGEILLNHPDDNMDLTAVQNLNIVDFLQAHFFDRIQSPFADRKLTFNKSCRFKDVELISAGMKTTGCLWQLGDIISTENCNPATQWQWNYKPSSFLDERRARILVGLALKLRQMRHYVLSNKLQKLAESCPTDLFFSKWKFAMAMVITEAIEQGKPLRVAKSYRKDKENVGIFVLDEDLDTSSPNGKYWPSYSNKYNTKKLYNNPPNNDTYIFTSFEEQMLSEALDDCNDVNKHVSIAVDCPQLKRWPNRRPELYVKHWVNGLCFYNRSHQDEVLFPWPRSFKDRVF